jgi:O-acetyl-ADP-ribose deacetylase (regulator of RNase III)
LAETHTLDRPPTGGVTVHHSLVRLVRADITALEVEAIVFYARPDLALGSGFGSAIARRGGGSIKKELDAIGQVAVTEAVVTTGGTLKAGRIVHAVGPAFQEPDLEKKLRQTVINALKRADAEQIRQIAFPAMGAGFYGIPLARCAEVLVAALKAYLSGDTGLREVIFCANDNREYLAFEAGLAALDGSAR